MKRLLWFISILSTSLSCSVDNTLEDGTNSILLNFDVNKADWQLFLKSDNTSDIAISDMIVYGYYTQDTPWIESSYKTPSFMNGVVVTNINGIWSYHPLCYFHENGYHSFFAYAPFNLINSNNLNSLSISSQGEPTLNYNLSENISDHYDLLVGSKIDVINNAENAPVDIQFLHATTKITLSVGLDAKYILPPFLSVKIDSVCFNNIYTSGDIQLSYNTESANILWSNLSSIKDINLSIKDQTLQNNELSTTFTPLLANNKALFMIPQPLAERGSGQAYPSLSINYSIHNNITDTTNSYTYTYSLAQMSKNWISGQALNFRISYSGGQNPISLILVDPGSENIEDLGEPIS